MATYIDDPLLGIGWNTFDDPVVKTDQHVIPMNDDRKHDLHSKCWCLPIEGHSCSWFHNDLDGRTEYQLRWRKPH